LISFCHFRSLYHEKTTSHHTVVDCEFESARTKAPAEEEEQEFEYAKLNNQFVIPLVQDGTVAALVVMSLSVEVDFGHKDDVFRKEPKLRDSFLQVMFDHANIGGFRGDFTRFENLNVLRTGLREVAQRDVGEHVKDVLIIEIARQDY